MSDLVLRAEGLIRWRGGKAVVRHINLELHAGESVALIGPSGCGKTTLLHMLALLDRPSGGRLWLDGLEPWAASARERAALRLRRLGFVFQQSNLIPFLTARENVALPAWRLGGVRAAALARADTFLERFGLSHSARRRAAVLSLGEAQRVATARALVNRPVAILADEPTGSIDSAATEAVLAAFEEVRRQGSALLVATHDPDVAARMGRIVRMYDGTLAGG